MFSSQSGIEGSVESLSSCWSVNINAIGTCSLEISICIINDAGRQAAHKENNQNTYF
jgi:hypothetical protein